MKKRSFGLQGENRKKNKNKNSWENTCAPLAHVAKILPFTFFHSFTNSIFKSKILRCRRVDTKRMKTRISKFLYLN